MSRFADDCLINTLLAIVGLVALMPGCWSESATEGQQGKLPPISGGSHNLIAATNYPLAQIAKSIAGQHFEVWTPPANLVAGNQRPEISHIRKLQTADVILTNGLGANDANWLNFVTVDENRIFDTTKNGFELSDFIQIHQHQIVHSHGDEGEHSHPWLVPHCWLSPRLLQVQAIEIKNLLIQTYPQHKQDFEVNFKNTADRIAELETQTQQVRQRIQQQKVRFVLSDPRSSFFFRSIGANREALLWFEAPDKEQAQADWQALLNRLALKNGEKVVLCHPVSLSQPVRQIANLLKVDTLAVDLIEAPRTGWNIDLQDPTQPKLPQSKLTGKIGISEIDFDQRTGDNCRSINAFLDEMR